MLLVLVLVLVVVLVVVALLFANTGWTKVEPDATCSQHVLLRRWAFWYGISNHIYADIHVTLKNIVVLLFVLFFFVSFFFGKYTFKAAFEVDSERGVVLSGLCCC